MTHTEASKILYSKQPGVPRAAEAVVGKRPDGSWPSQASLETGMELLGVGAPTVTIRHCWRQDYQ